jgi:hypothetical protein
VPKRIFLPRKVAFFGWTAASGNILSIGNLRRRGIIVNRCSKRKICEESVDRLLLHCDVANEL